MQVQHETQLLEGPTLKSEDFLADETSSSLDVYALNQATLSSIEWVASCPTRNLVAVYLNGANQIVIIDTKTNSKRERFPLKPCGKRFSKKSLALKGIDFSPDGQRLAVGQSDCIIYIYKLPNAHANQQINSSTEATPMPSPLVAPTQPLPLPQAKATISGKFVCSTPVTCLLWTELGIVFGTQDGKIKLASMGPPTKAASSSGETKVIAVYNPPKANMPISIAFKSPILVVGFLNSDVIAINLTVGGESPASATATLDQADLGQTFGSTSNLTGPRRSSSLVPLNNYFDHSCPPYQLVILQSNLICCAGSNGQVSFYQPPSGQGVAGNKMEVNMVQCINLKEDVVSMDYSPINEILALATTSRLMFIKYDPEASTWQLQNSFIELTQVAVTSLKWLKCDGSQLVVGQSNGNLELFKCSWSKQSIGEQFDICHIAKNRVRIADRARNLLATYKSQYDIKRVNLLNKGQSVIIWTTHTILLARLGQLQQSEISWGRERNQIKFCFDYAGFVLLYNPPSSTLNLIRLGENKIAYSVRLESGFNRRLISVRQYHSRRFLNQSVDQANSKPAPTGHHRSSAGLSRSRHGSMVLGGMPEIQVSPDLATTSEMSSLSTNQQQAVAIINERLALVLESNLITVINLINSTNQKELTLRHNHPVRWIELSYTGTCLVFVDALNQMHLINLSHDEKKPLVVAESSEFSRWLPETDILVAQSAHKIMIWYNVEEVKNIESYDSRTYNCTERLPLLDLSLLPRQQAYPVVRTIENQDQLVLSNGQVVVIDKVKVRFYTEIVRARFDLALEVLSKSCKSAASGRMSHLELWYKLGWLAIDHDDCQLAIMVFKRLRHQKMVRYMEKCLETPEELPWRLAMLKGDWQGFEALLAPDQIVSTYRRLNKWSRLIDYLERNQQFRQRDLVEQEYKQWLLKEGRHLEAAKIQAKAGDKLGAVELLMENNKLSEAVQLFVDEQKSPLKVRFSSDEKLVELAQRLRRLLLKEGRLMKEAALISDRLLEAKEEALELYLKAEAYEEALDLAKSVRPDQVATIEGLIGDQLMLDYRAHKKSRKQALKAIEHFAVSGRIAEALGAAIELKQFERAYDLLQDSTRSDSIEATSLREKSREVADYFLLKKHDVGKATAAYLAGGHHNKALELYLRASHYRAAFELSLISLHGGERDKARAHFVELAEKMAQDGRIDEAERVYLEALEEPEGAIELHKRWSRNHERMLELLELYQPDQLEGQLLRLAKELEQAERFEEAERYLLKVSDTEWTNVVRMYRLAGKWAEAFRVAGNNCASREDPLLVQLAFWWSKSLGDLGQARELLLRLELLQQVLGFCCNNKGHQFALDLCRSGGDTSAGRRVAARYAGFLEEQGKFGRAEEVLLEFGLVEEACRMYLDNDMPAEAIRVAEQKLDNSAGEGHAKTELLNRVLVECADRLASECEPHMGPNLKLAASEPASDRRLEQARQMYLRAQRPELAVALYRSRGRWQEAVQVAQRFAPQLLEGLERALDEEVARGAVAEVVQQQQLEEESRSVSRSSSTLSGHQLLPGNSLAAGGKNTGDSRNSTSPQLASTNGARPLGKLQSLAEKSMRQGDSRATKAALAQFLDALVDGPSEVSHDSDIKR